MPRRDGARFFGPDWRKHLTRRRRKTLGRKREAHYAAQKKT